MSKQLEVLNDLALQIKEKLPSYATKMMITNFVDSYIEQEPWKEWEK